MKRQRSEPSSPVAHTSRFLSHSNSDAYTHGTVQAANAASSLTPSTATSDRSAKRHQRLHPSTGPQNVSYLENATNFVINHPIMGGTHINQVQGISALDKMLDHIIPGAEYDSSARDPPPSCHPGTRTQILDDIRSRIHDNAFTTRMVWINGPAGVGKSAIMQTFAESESSNGTKLTSLFFSRPNKRDDPKKAFPTLAYHLACVDKEYRHYIEEHLTSDPTFLTKSMDEQFRRLFIVPFVDDPIHLDAGRWVVVLDGLDECLGEAEQGRIIDLIRTSIADNTKSTPFVWVIASRPEAHLKAPFRRARASVTGFWELHVPIDSDTGAQDVERYLRAQFSKIQENYPDEIPPNWPSESDFLKLAATSSGLFVFASTSIGYLENGDPVLRLEHILSLIQRSEKRPGGLDQNPFHVLDLLYMQIMSDIPEEIFPTTKLLLAFYLLETDVRFRRLTASPMAHFDVEGNLAVERPPFTFLEACNTLGLQRYAAYAALRKLYSVVTCPSPIDADHMPIRFLHASFSNFLMEPSRSQMYHIDLNQEISKIWQCYIRILCQSKAVHGSDSIRLTWSPDNSLHLKNTLLGRACQWWMLILFSWRPATRMVQHPGLYLLTEIPYLVETFQNLGSAIFSGVNGHRFPIVEFLGWLNKDAPKELRQRILHESFPVHELDVDRLFKSLCARRWSLKAIRSRTPPHPFVCQNVDLTSLTCPDVSQWAQAKEALWQRSTVLEDLFLAKDAPVTVVGMEPSELCVVVGPIYTESLDPVYYVLPYLGEFSEEAQQSDTRAL